MRLISYQPQLAAWSPLDRLASLRDLLDSAFELANAPTSALRGRGWAPALDVYENADRITVKLEAAGLTKEAFEISLHDDNLTISGERKPAEEPRDGESFRSERSFGAFSRTVTLPGPVKPEAVTATYEDGVLTVVLPKAEEAKPRKIAVDVK